ncbi:MAG: putative toxin-antitoxin system toxin component, PIN family [Planctomycetes bacterium]|nr:putative toxin-antitoxin system toxin component, PIN family [Planctomycetota bacterium]
MSARKHRVPVVLDTNVFVRNFKARKNASSNRRIVRLWLLEKKLQLIVSEEVVAEYLEIFDEILGMDLDILNAWRWRFTNDPRVTMTNLGRRDDASRDADDNVFLSTARAGNARYLVTNDRDLLEVPNANQFPFAIVKPEHFLAQLNDAV